LKNAFSIVYYPVVLLTAMLASHLNEKRLIGFALLGPRREKLTETTMHARAKVRAQPLTGSELLEGGDLTPGRLIVCTAFRLNLLSFWTGFQASRTIRFRIVSQQNILRFGRKSGGGQRFRSWASTVE